MLLGLAAPAGAQTDFEKVTNAVHTVRLELEATLGKPVPSLSLLVQTPANTFFTCSAASPAQVVATNTSFRFASNTKNFTATAVLLLQQMGLLHITNRVVDMMPGTAEPYLPASTNWSIPHKDRITIAQLLRHSAGIYDVDNDLVPGCGEDSYTGWMMAQDPTHQFTQEELAGQIARYQLSYFAPDEGYHYSNTGYSLLAEIVARVYSQHMGTAKTLSDFLYEQVGVAPAIRFPNLASDTDLPDPYSPGTEYYPSNVVVVTSNVNISAQVGEGNGYGTLAALNHHIRTLLKGAGVLSSESLQLMTTTTSPYNADYGLGCTYWPNVGFGHNGSRVGNLSLMVYNPDTDVSLVVYLAVKDMSDGMTSFIACFVSMYTAASRVLEALGYVPVPQVHPGQSTNLVLAAGATNRFYFTAQKDVYYGVRAGGATSDVRLAIAPMVNPAAAQTFTNQAGWVCPAPGAYQITVQAAAATPAQLRLYTLTNTIAQTATLITNLMAAQSVPALSIALVDGAHVVWAQGFGMANREAGIPASADTIYRLASVSKTFAAASTLRLQDDGLLSITDDITNTIPAFALLPRYPDQALSIRELLAHQAQLPGCYFRHADSTIPFDGYYDMMLALMAEDYLVEPRHFLQKYNNNGFTLIEGVVAGANTNGLDYAAFAITNLFQPMGMSNTTFHLANHQTNLLAKVYRNGVLAPDEFVNTPGSGGAYSTAADMARYARFLLGYGTFNGTRILSSNAVAALWSDQSAQVALVNKEDYAKSGLGWDQIADPSFAYAGRMAWKDGDSLNYSAIICVMPEHGLAAVALNSIPGADNAAAPAAKLALKLALQERDGIPLPSTNPPAFPVSPVTELAEQELAGITGIYSAAGGYDLVTGTVSAITWITGADGSSPVRHEGLVPHQDGWFSTTNAPEFRLSFTNIGGRVILRNQVRYGEYLRIIVQAERFTPAPLSAAWSNRVGKTWITADLEPESYLWFLGFYPTLQLGIADGVLSVYSSPCQTLQPQGDDLAFPFSMNAAQPSALQVKHTNGHEVIRYSGYDFLRVDDLPVLQPGQSATGILAAGASAPFQFTITDPVWHGIHIFPSNLLLRQATADLSAPGTYSLILQNPGTSAAPYSLRLYNLTSTIARVSSLITNLMATHQLVGCGVSLVDGDQTVWQTGFGYADRERGLAADAHTAFMIGSVSKTFGALAAMQLAEEGLLDLHASITNALPAFAIHQRFADNTITPHTILTHHSGLPGDVFNQGFTVRPLPGVPDAVQAMLANEYTLMPTNTMWAYNNSGFVMLGQMFRHLTGQELDVFARARLFDRMGMTNSSIAFDLPAIQQNRARPYVGGQINPDEYVNLYFAGAIYSTAADMARYMRMLLAGGLGENARVVSNQTLQAMATRQNAGIALDQYVSMLNMGIGFLLDPLSLQYMGKVIWHDGGTVYFRSLLRVATEAQLGCFISCNSYEGSAMNYTVVDSALQWAYEEKTGIAPPAPLDPGTPAVAVAPPEVISMATGGVFVTGGGYDTFRHDGTHLLARFNAQLDDSHESTWAFRENGWFTPTNAYAPQLEFVQAEGRILSVLQTFDYAVTNLILLGERSADIAAFHPAWSNRLGRWWATDLHPDEIAWHGDELRLAWPMLQLYARDNLLLVQVEDLYVMSATNDALAFAAGLGRNKGSSLRTVSPDTLAYMGVNYRSEAGIPQLAPGASTNGSTLGDEIQWFQIPAAASSLTFDLATEHDLAAYLYTQDDEYLGQANRSHAFRLDAANAQPVLAAVIRNGTNTGPWQFAVHTNAVPFYHSLAPQDWPTDLIAHSNLYGNLEFGYVFVHENRTNQSAQLLKLAVARMVSTNAAAKPYFFCHGGPGTSSIRCTLAEFLRDFTDTHDVYLLDQRGINYSQPCLDLRTAESMGDGQYRFARLQDADLSTINTLESSYDLDDIAQSLSLTNVTLHGHSYGSFLVQTLMRRAPAWLGAVILDGVIAPNIMFLNSSGPIRYHAHQALFADVAAHPTAALLYPDFETTFYALARRLTNSPVTVWIGGVPMAVDGYLFQQLVEGQMGVSDLGYRERIPNIVWRASHGETQALTELAEYHYPFDNASSAMMSLLLDNHDFMPFFSMDEVLHQCEGIPDVVRDAYVQFLVQTMALLDQLVPCGQADNSTTNPVSSSIPALVINGDYDRATGTNWAAEVASRLPNAQLVIAPTIGHGVLYATNGCMAHVFRQFLANPTNALDTSCVDALALDFPPPWLGAGTHLALGQSVTNTFAQPNSGAWRSFAAVSGVVYSVQQAAGPRLIVVDALACPLATADTARLEWESPAEGTYYLWTIAPEAGEYSMLFDLPLLLRALTVDGSQLTLRWQAYTNTTCDAWMATNLLDSQGAHVLIATNIPPQGWFTTFDHTDGTTNAFSAYYLRKAAE